MSDSATGGARASARLTALLCCVAFLDLVLWLVVIPLLPEYEQRLGLTKDEAGLVVGAYSAAILVASIPAGRLADRVGAKRATVTAIALFAVSAPALGLADGMWELVAVRFVQGLCSAVSWSAGLAWLLARSPEDRRARRLVAVNSAATAGSLAGPFLGGPLAAALGLEAMMWAFGGIVAVIAVWAAFEPAGTGRAAPSVGLAGAARIALRPGLLRAAFVGMAFVGISGTAVQLLAPLHLGDEGLSGAEIGWVFTAAAVVTLVETLYLARIGDHVDRVRVVMLATAAVAVMSLVLAAGLGLVPFVVAVVAFQVATLPIFVFSYPVCAEGAAAAGVGPALALGALNAVWAAAAVISPLVFGWLAEQTADSVAYAAVGVLGGLAALAMARSSRQRVAGQSTR